MEIVLGLYLVDLAEVDACFWFCFLICFSLLSTPHELEGGLSWLAKREQLRLG